MVGEGGEKKKNGEGSARVGWRLRREGEEKEEEEEERLLKVKGK